MSMNAKRKFNNVEFFLLDNRIILSFTKQKNNVESKLFLVFILKAQHITVNSLQKKKVLLPENELVIFFSIQI